MKTAYSLFMALVLTLVVSKAAKAGELFNKQGLISRRANMRKMQKRLMFQIVFLLPFTFLISDSGLALINGDITSPERLGIVKFETIGGSCSGVLLTNDWVLTERHCFNIPDGVADPSKTLVTMGTQRSKAQEILVNYGSAGTLIRLEAPFQMNGAFKGYSREMYTDWGASLQGKQVRCYGYGGTPFGTLRTAIFTVNPDRGDASAFFVEKNSKEQSMEEGDSGGPCFYTQPDGQEVIAGILWQIRDNTQAFELTPVVYGGWALHHIRKDYFGSAIAIGDFNGDGYDDLAIGYPGEQVESTRRVGTVKLYKGGRTGLRFWQTLTQAGLGAHETGDKFGYSLAAGDFDGDGRDDLAVGAPGEAPGAGPKSGYVFVFRGSADGLQPWQGLDQRGLGANEADDQFGYSLAAGDFDGDGRDDLAVGAPGEAPGAGPKSGYVFVFRGSADGLQPWQGLEHKGVGVDEEFARFGHALAVGDLDGDGLEDLAVSAVAEWVSDSSKASGFVFVYKATSSGLRPWVGLDQRALGTNEWAELYGWALSIGDFNGDGLGDLVLHHSEFDG